ncbi:HAMP domain-containing histidine kinase [Ramlibacter sp. AW1]|uniref:histidine kinase n=1 Tax=Ramlibacter aurantiacus TaxID=2801330 RepID=A0A936ZMK2_9BURK|nr:HAMP domain-containing sensor histidine kinase [Ramlibacter aurantiacus]MBL0422938.1 HAMP domain-containing histidine kinase [Ramlibacter aurantiacus]
MSPTFKSDTVAAPRATAEAQWVEAELVRTLMSTVRSTKLTSMLLVPLYLALLWGETRTVPLALWAVVAILVLGARAQVAHHYVQYFSGAAPQRLLAFYGRVRLLWAASAAVWGATVWLFFDTASLASQFIAWLLLAGIAMFAVNGLASHLQTVRLYVNVLVGFALGWVAWWAVVELRLQGPYYHFWLMALLVLFWQVLHQAAQRLHRTHRRNFELQYRNIQLISSLTRQTQAALDAVEIKNRFLASATHDIRQPVHALGLYADWLANEPELVRELAPKIVESTKAINTLFDSLFDLVRLDSGKIRLQIEDISMTQLFSELEVQYRPVALAKGLEFRMRPASGMVRSDLLLLKRLVGNLVSNAIKYTERGGVLVAVRHRAGKPCIEVWDTGVGIAPVHQRDIFREFYKVPIHAGTEDGFGLGLYIVGRLSHILGHPVELASRVGRGTMFRVLLKPTDADEAASRASTAIDQLARRP